MIGMAIGGSANFTTSLPAAIFGRHEFDKVNSVIFPVQGLITSMNWNIYCFNWKLKRMLCSVYRGNFSESYVNKQNR